MYSDAVCNVFVPPGLFFLLKLKSKCPLVVEFFVATAVTVTKNSTRRETKFYLISVISICRN